MLEPDVTLTDYFLSLICAVFAWQSWHRHAVASGWYVAFFLTLSLASLLGGTVHGFVPTGPWSEWLWCGVLFSLGGTALAMWGITTALACSPAVARRVMSVMAVLAVVYVAVVLSGVRDFWITIVAYLPAAVGLLVVYVRNRHHPGAWWGIVGVVLTFIAAGVQVGQVALHPVWFNHNALYHLIQAIALFGIAQAAGGRVTGGSPPVHDASPQRVS